MSESIRREEEIFTQVLALPAKEREAFLHRICGDDPALLQRVADLIRAAEQAGQFLETPPTLVTPARSRAQAAADVPGERMGRYTLGRKLGEGGAGVVYEAEQTEPVRRRVALKLMKPGTDTEAAIARFEAERQALAMMEHPAIARVYDAGATEQGRLYFAMEFVEGERITEYCDRNRLPMAARLELFVHVCHAVQHAHQKGIIHRDIKPSNVLVVQVDGVSVPKVIDFGIAKATQGQLGAGLTALEQFIGTPAYMSPEQALGSAHGIDTRSDIYSLGVLLYELLTGLTPFDAQELARAGLDAVQRALSEREPPRPSERLRTTGAGDLAEIARCRRVDPPVLIRRVRGDLDWIVLRAMERDRDRRYGTADEFAADIGRHLRDDPIVARPPSRIDRLHRLVRRNRLGVAFAATMALTLVVVAVVSTLLAVRATRAERRESGLRVIAEQAQRQEASQRARAEAGEARAQVEAARSAEVGRFLAATFKGVAPQVALGRDTTLLREILDQAAERMDQDLKEQPEVESELRQVLASVYVELGLMHTRGEEMLRRAVELERRSHPTPHPDVVKVLTAYAELTRRRGYMHESAPLFGEAADLQRQLGGPDDPALALALAKWASTLVIIGDLDRAEATAREAVSIYRSMPGGGGLAIARPLGVLARVQLRRYEPSEADALQQEALAVARGAADKEHLDTVRELITQQALIHFDRNDNARAEACETEALENLRTLYGSEHPYVGHQMCWVGWAIFGQLDFPRAQLFFEDAVTQMRRFQQSYLFCGLHGAGASSLFVGDLTKAEAAMRESREMVVKKMGLDSNQAGWVTSDLAVIVFARGRRDEALELLDEALQVGVKAWPEGTANIFAALRGFDEMGLGDSARRPVEIMLRDAVDRSRGGGASMQLEAVDILGLLAALQYRRGSYAEAAETLQEALHLRLSAEPLDERVLAQVRFSLAVTLMERGQTGEAEDLLREIVLVDRRSRPKPDLALLWAVCSLGRARLGRGDLDGADACFREVLELAASVENSRVEDLAVAHEGLGLSAFRRGELSVAERELLEANRMFLSRSVFFENRRDPCQPRKVAEHIAALYESWAATDPARVAVSKMWRRRLVDLRAVEAEQVRPHPLPPMMR